jgi:hypothetical protein
LDVGTGTEGYETGNRNQANLKNENRTDTRTESHFLIKREPEPNRNRHLENDAN